jgi:hypothetical protein
MATGLGINRDRLFEQRRLLPFIAHHKAFIEARLAGMAVNPEEAAQESYKSFIKHYLSFGVVLNGVKDEPTWERARDEEKRAAGWEEHDGILFPPQGSAKPDKKGKDEATPKKEEVKEEVVNATLSKPDKKGKK